MELIKDDILKLVEATLREDCPSEDVTTAPLVDETEQTSFKIVAKEKMVACGASVAKEFFIYLNDNMEFMAEAQDGTELNKGDLFLSGKGPVRAILAAERSALNVVQRLCGISTMTNRFVVELRGLSTKVLDTRKTTPGLRKFEKYAVKIGGGENHRFGLSDMVLLKENHLKYEEKNGPFYIKRAVEKCKKLNPEIKTEVEIQNVSQAEQACESGVDVIMLDNMSFQEIRDCVKIIDKRALIEVSGGITLETIRSFALPGVDYISVGALTHSVKSSDLSLLTD